MPAKKKAAKPKKAAAKPKKKVAKSAPKPKVAPLAPRPAFARPAQVQAPAAPAGPQAPASKEYVGDVAAYFGGVSVIAIDLTAGLNVGDEIWVERGDNLSFRQRVDSMQIDRVPVQSATKGQSVGIKVSQKAAPGNKVYRITK
ncbi:MAG: hypothetical protein ABH829_02090 [archaeon]